MDKSIRGLMAVVLLALGGTGCIAEAGEESTEGSDADADEVEVGEASDAFGAIGYWSHGGNAAASWPLGSLTGVGFVMGMTGNIGNGGATASFIEVGDSPSQIVWHHNPVGGRALGSWVGTLAPSSGETGIKIYESFGTTSTTFLETAFANGKRRCFLTKIKNNNSSHNAFANVGDALEIIQEGNQFKVRASGRAGGSARCITVTDMVWSAWAAWSANDSDLDLGPEDAANGKHCYLTGIGGSFRANEYDKGAYIYKRSWDNRWRLKVTAGKFASAECSI